MKEDRNPEPRVLHDPRLQQVSLHDAVSRALVHAKKLIEEGIGAKPIAKRLLYQRFVQLVLAEETRKVHAKGRHIHPRLQLGDLLLESHPADQIANALGYRRFRILIDRLGLLLGPRDLQSNREQTNANVTSKFHPSSSYERWQA